MSIRLGVFVDGLDVCHAMLHKFLSLVSHATNNYHANGDVIKAATKQ